MTHEELKDWEARFVSFGGILLTTLQWIANDENCEHSKLARERLDKFNGLVKRTPSVMNQLTLKCLGGDRIY